MKPGSARPSRSTSRPPSVSGGAWTLSTAELLESSCRRPSRVRRCSTTTSGPSRVRLLAASSSCRSLFVRARPEPALRCRALVSPPPRAGRAQRHDGRLRPPAREQRRRRPTAAPTVAALRHQRPERRRPRRAVAVALLELAPQRRLRALEPRAHGGDGAAEASRDLARRERLPVAQEHRGAVRLLELERVARELALALRPLDDARGRRLGLGARDGFLARTPVTLTAIHPPRHVPHDRREPGALAPFVARPVLERGDPGVLRRVVRGGRIAEQRAGEGADPVGVAEETVGLEGGVGLHGRGDPRRR